MTGEYFFRGVFICCDIGSVYQVSGKSWHTQYYKDWF